MFEDAFESESGDFASDPAASDSVASESVVSEPAPFGSIPFDEDVWMKWAVADAVAEEAFLASLPADPGDPPAADDDAIDPPIVLGTAGATDAALERLRRTARWARMSEARRFEALLSAVDAIHAEHEAVGDPVLTASILTRGFTIEAGACLLVDPRTVESLLTTARAVRESLPVMWAGFRAGDCGWRSVETAYRESVGLDAEHLPEFDIRAATLAGTETVGRLARDLTRLRERLQADTAVERARCSARGRHVQVAPLRDGQAILSIVGPSPAVASIYDGLTKAAIAVRGDADEHRPLGALRHDLAIDLLLDGLHTDARPDIQDGAENGAGPAVASGSASGTSSAAGAVQRLRVPTRRAVTPTCLIVLPAPSVLGKSDEPAELAGCGPVDIDTAMQAAGDAGYWTRVFTDPATGTLTGIDSHADRIPASIRRWLHARDGTCRAPGCSRPASTCDIDHTIRREHDGPTNPDNLSCLCRTHHQIKDDGCWDLTLHPDGTQHWHSIWGTTRVTRPATTIGVLATEPPPQTASRASTAPAVPEDPPPCAVTTGLRPIDTASTAVVRPTDTALPLDDCPF